MVRSTTVQTSLSISYLGAALVTSCMMYVLNRVPSRQFQAIFMKIIDSQSRNICFHVGQLLMLEICLIEYEKLGPKESVSINTSYIQRHM